MDSPDTLAVLKALSEEMRIRIVSLLLEAEDLCACEIETLLGLSQSNASRHLARLKDAGLIESEKRAQWVHYRLDRRTMYRYPFVQTVVHAARDDHPILGADIERLHEYRESGATCTTIREWSADHPGRIQPFVFPSPAEER